LKIKGIFPYLYLKMEKLIPIYSGFEHIGWYPIKKLIYIKQRNKGKFIKK